MKTWEKIKNQPARINAFKLRQEIIAGVRDFFKDRRFLEVDTPLLVSRPSMDSYLEVYETSRLDENRRPMPAYLTTSPEYAMKKILAAGLPKIFQICKCFRNAEGQSSLHNSEFTILEWYQTDVDYLTAMRDCEQLFFYLAKKIHKSDKLVYQGRTLDLTPPWARISVADAFKKFVGINVSDLFDKKKMQAVAKKRGYFADKSTTSEQLFHQIILNEIEAKLGMVKPTFLYDYPASLPSLARKKATDLNLVERFELYLFGIEVGNAFSELTDKAEQEARLVRDKKLRRQQGKTSFAIDQDFLDALASGIPASAGVAIGVDRLVMFFANVPSIHEVLFFPDPEIFPKG